MFGLLWTKNIFTNVCNNCNSPLNTASCARTCIPTYSTFMFISMLTASVSSLVLPHPHPFQRHHLPPGTSQDLLPPFHQRRWMLLKWHLHYTMHITFTSLHGQNSTMLLLQWRGMSYFTFVSVTCFVNNSTWKQRLVVLVTVDHHTHCSLLARSVVDVAVQSNRMLRSMSLWRPCHITLS